MLVVVGKSSIWDGWQLNWKRMSSMSLWRFHDGRQAFAQAFQASEAWRNLLFDLWARKM